MLCPACGHTEANKLPTVKFEDGEKFQVECARCKFLIKDFDGVTWTINFAQMIARNLAQLYQDQDIRNAQRQAGFPFVKTTPKKESFRFDHVQVGDKKVERQSLGVYHAVADAKFLPPVPAPPRYAQFKDYWLDLDEMEKFLEKEFLEGL